MKLFQKILLAPATLGLLTPVLANANEANLSDVASYSKSHVEVSLDSFKPLSNKNPLLAGGEGMNQSNNESDSNFDVDTFSSTTTASFTSNFALGSVEGTSGDKLGMNYDWEMALSTGFNGNDTLDVVINGGASSLMTELDMTNTGSRLEVDSVSYTTGLGDRTTAFFASGNGASGSSLYNTACVYGAQADTFSNCGVSAANIDEGLGTAAGASFDFENGFAASIGYEGQGMSTHGIATDEGVDAYGAQVSYLGNSFGVSLSWANIENHDDGTIHGDHGQTQSRGLNAYFKPDLPNFPSLSAGFETSHDDSEPSSEDDSSHYFFGIQWDDLGNGTLGAAVGSKAPYKENADTHTMYEVFYSYNYADGITITPLMYSKDNGGSSEDETGLIVKTEFSF
mgnify:CR=1 FL=1